MLSARRTTWDVEDGWIALHGRRLNTWSVEDQFIDFRGLGDPVDDVIADMRSSNTKVRLSATLALANRASNNTNDKRAVGAMIERLADVEPAIRGIAAAAFTIPGWIDANVDPCLRNRAIANLQANAEVDPARASKAKAAEAAKFLLELGMLDRSRLPLAEMCGPGAPPFVPPTGPDVGPLVNPSSPTGLSMGEKVAVAGAALLAISVFGYAILGGKDPAQMRKRVKRR